MGDAKRPSIPKFTTEDYPGPGEQVRALASMLAGRPGTLQEAAVSRLSAAARSALPGGGTYGDELARWRADQAQRYPELVGLDSVVPQVRRAAQQEAQKEDVKDAVLNVGYAGLGALLPSSGRLEARILHDPTAAKLAAQHSEVVAELMKQRLDWVDQMAERVGWVSDLQDHLQRTAEAAPGEGGAEPAGAQAQAPAQPQAQTPRTPGPSPRAVQAASMLPLPRIRHYQGGGSVDPDVGPIHQPVAPVEAGVRRFLGNLGTGFRAGAQNIPAVFGAEPAGPPPAPEPVPSHGPAPVPVPTGPPPGAVPFASHLPAGPATSASPMDPFAALLRQAQPPGGAMMEIARAEAARGQAEAEAARSKQAWSDTMLRWSDDARHKIDADYQATVEDYKNSAINPAQVWHDKSGPQKALSLLGVLLSGVGSGLTGQPNAAMGLIQRQIEMDLEAQVREMDKRKNLVSMNLERYGHLDEAIRASYLQKMAYYEAKAQEIAATSSEAEAVPKAKVAIYQMRQSLLPIQLQMAQYQGLQNYLRQGGFSIGSAPPPWTWEQLTATAIPGPNGTTTFARNPTLAQPAIEGLSKWENYDQALRQLTDMRVSGAVLPLTEARAEFQHRREAAVLALAQAQNVSRGEALKKVEAQVPQAWERFVHGEDTMKPLEDLSDNGRHAIWENMGSLRMPREVPLPDPSRPPPGVQVVRNRWGRVVGVKR